MVIRYVSEPKFRLTLALEPSCERTLVSWTQEFENPEIARRIEHIVVPANEQDLERLAAEVLRR